MNAHAQLPIKDVDMNAFGKDIVSTNNKGQQLLMSIWMPSVYWKIVEAQSNSIPPGTMDQIVSILDNYVVICLLKSELDPEKTNYLKNVPENTLRKITTIEIDGKSYKPINYSDLPEDVQMTKDILEPTFMRMMGTMGEGICVFYFKVQNENGNLIDPYKSTSFKILVGKDELSYNLPFSCLYPDKICPTDQQALPANFKFCPYHGVALPENSAVPAGE